MEWVCDIWAGLRQVLQGKVNVEGAGVLSNGLSDYATKGVTEQRHAYAHESFGFICQRLQSRGYSIMAVQEWRGGSPKLCGDG